MACSRVNFYWHMPERAERELGERRSCESQERAVRAVCGTSFLNPNIAASTNSAFTTVLIASPPPKFLLPEMRREIRSELQDGRQTCSYVSAHARQGCSASRTGARASETEEQLCATHHVFGVNRDIGYPLHQLIMTFLRAIVAGCR